MPFANIRIERQSKHLYYSYILYYHVVIYIYVYIYIGGNTIPLATIITFHQFPIVCHDGLAINNNSIEILYKNVNITFF